MTNNETALADKLLKEATDALDPIQRRERIEDYNLLVRAACTRRDATSERRESFCLAANAVNETPPKSHLDLLKDRLKEKGCIFEEDGFGDIFTIPNGGRFCAREMERLGEDHIRRFFSGL